jgi:hypothetical protein
MSPERSKSLERAISILEQCRDTLEWQVGTGIAAVDFIYPKIKYALGLLDVSEEEESTTGEELRNYTFDFVMTAESDED